MKKLLVAFLLGAGLFAALSYHVILTSGDQPLVIERKGEMGFAETFVDTRGWGPIDWLNHPRVLTIVTKHGIQSRLDSDGASKAAKDAVEKLRKAIDEGLDKVQEKEKKR